MATSKPLPRSAHKSRVLDRKWRKHPANPAVPSKDNANDSLSSKSAASEPVGFRNKTTLDLVQTCIRQYSGMGNDDYAETEPGDLRPLDETSLYGIKEEDSSNLLELEVKRLLAVVDDDEPLLFPSGANIGCGTETLLHDLSGIADQILCNLYICRLDTQVIYLQSDRTSFDSRDYSISRETLIERLNPDLPQKHPTRLELENSKNCFMLVNLITAVIARLCIRSISLQSFQTRLIVHLATLSMKLKILEPDPVQNAEISIENGDETAERLKLEYLTDYHGITGSTKIKFKEEHKYEGRAKAAIYDLASRAATDTFSARRRDLYYAEMAMMRGGLFSLLMKILIEMKGDSMRQTAQLLFGRGADQPLTRTFNNTSLVYGAGFSSHSTLISQDREGELGASASPQGLVASYNAYTMLVQTANAVASASNTEKCEGPAWSLSWRMQTADSTSGDSGTLSTSSPQTILSVMVPLLCCSASVTKVISRMLYMETAFCNFRDGVFETRSSVKFEAMATLQTLDPPDAANIPDTPSISALATSAIACRKLAYDPVSAKPRGKKGNRVGTDLAAKEVSNDMWRVQLREVGQII